MMLKIMLAGFGGQGIILAGKLLAQAAMGTGLNVTHFPSYGAEMRGGTCNCSVIISDRDIASPLVTSPDIAIIMNQPSKKKFESKVKEGGKIITNSSLITEKPLRDDISEYRVDASNIADSLGNVKAANMVMLGSLLKVSGLMSLDAMIESLDEVISSRNKSLIELNEKALKKGFELVRRESFIS